MPFQWNVQPYQRLSELREEYTQVMIAGTNRMLNQLAPEIEAWMKKEARWQDRTHAARDSLQARVVAYNNEDAEYRSGLRDAARQDASLLRQLNEGRRRGITYGTTTYTSKRTGETITTIDKNSANRTPSQSALIPLKRLPSKLSAVSAFKANQLPNKVLIGEIRLGYGDNPRAVPHAIWLEIANQGRYAIISRATEYWGSKLHGRLRQVAKLKQFEGLITFGDEVSAAETFSRYAAKEARLEGYTPHDPVRRKMKVARRRRERQIRRERERTGGTYTRKIRSDRGSRRK